MLPLGFEELGDKAFDSLGDLFAAAPSLLRMRGWRSLHAMVCSHLRNEKLRVVMSFHPLLIGGNPMSVTCVYSADQHARAALRRALGDGRHRRAGAGHGQAARRARRGVRCNAEVERITVEGGRATGIELADGSMHRADIVVSNADTAWTYRHLIEPQHRRHWTDQRIERGRYSMSLFVWYFGTRSAATRTCRTT